MGFGHTRRRLAPLAVLASISALAGCPPPDGGEPGGTTTTTTTPRARCGAMVEQLIDDGRGAMVSADGSRVVYIHRDRVRVRDIATGVDRDAAPNLPTGLFLFDLQITPDGDRAAVSANGRAWLIDLDAADATELDLAAANVRYVAKFSADLSVAVGIPWSDVGHVYLVPIGGGPLERVAFPDTPRFVDLDGDTIAGYETVWRNGTRSSLPSQPSGAWIEGLNRAGTEVLLGTDSGAAVWHLGTGAVAPLTLPYVTSTGQTYGHANDDMSVFIGYVELDHSEGYWWIDRTTGEAIDMEHQLDGVTSISDDGRIVTSTVSPYFRCSG